MYAKGHHKEMETTHKNERNSSQMIYLIRDSYHEQVKNS